mgnify:CR=1 FL=1
MKLRLGDLSYDGSRRLLHRGAEEIHLSPRGFRLLTLLLERHPDVVPKAELRGTLRPDGPETEGGLTALASEVRHALSRSGAEGVRLRTVRGFGYAIEGPIEEVPGRVRHVLVRGRQEVDLGPGVNTVGREREVAVRIGHRSVEHLHARIVVTDDEAELEDVAGRGSTYRGADPVVHRVVLHDGDEIRVGEVVLTYRLRAAETGG